MTPKEKAIELVDKYMKFEFETPFVDTQRKYAKQCALIAVDEMIESTTDNWSHSPFWDQVRKEIESL